MRLPTQNLATHSSLSPDPEDKKNEEQACNTRIENPIPSTKPVTPLTDNKKGEVLSLSLPVLTATLSETQKTSGFFRQPNPPLVKEYELLTLSEHRAFAQLCKRSHALFQPALTTLCQERLQQLLNAVARPDLATVKKFLLADRTFRLFRLEGTATTSHGHILTGAALRMAYSARDHNLTRETGIHNEKCERWTMSAIPTEDNLPKDELRAYVFVKLPKATTYTACYFVERILANNAAFIEPVTFFKNSNAEILFNALSATEFKQTDHSLTPQQHTLIVRHTGYTYAEGIAETIEQHLRTLPDGEAIIAGQRPPERWYIEEKQRIAGDLEAIDNVIAVVKKISAPECERAHDVDTTLQQKVFDHNTLQALVQAVQNANDQETFDKAFNNLNSYYSEKSILARELKAQKQEMTTLDLLSVYLADNPTALAKVNMYYPEESKPNALAAESIQPLLRERDRLQNILQPLYRASDEKHFEIAFDALKDYITENKLIPESKSDTKQLLALDLLKVLFHYRNRLAPQGVRDGFHSNLHLLKHSATHYKTNYLSFGNNTNDPVTDYNSPFTAKNSFCSKKILGFALLVQADVDREAIINQGVYWLLERGQRLSRAVNTSSYFDSDPDRLLGYNLGMAQNVGAWAKGGSRFRLFITYVEQKHRPEPISQTHSANQESVCDNVERQAINP